MIDFLIWIVYVELIDSLSIRPNFLLYIFNSLLIKHNNCIFIFFLRLENITESFFITYLNDLINVYINYLRSDFWGLGY